MTSYGPCRMSSNCENCFCFIRVIDFIVLYGPSAILTESNIHHRLIETWSKPVTRGIYESNLLKQFHPFH